MKYHMGFDTEGFPDILQVFWLVSGEWITNYVQRINFDSDELHKLYKNGRKFRDQAT